MRTDPIIRMMVIAVAFYGMSTFEGPVMSIKSVNALSHYTDWTIGHVHSGALGWVGMITFGAIYFLVPRLWGRKQLYSLRMVNWHFWLATIGIVIYASVMWVAGIKQGLMWREYDDRGFPRLFVRRDGGGDEALLHLPCPRRRPLPLRRPRDGLQHLADHPRQGPQREADRRAARPPAPARRVGARTNGPS